MTTSEAPEWVHRLLTAFLTGEPLDFGKETPTADIRERLDQAYADGVLKGVPPTETTEAR